MKSKYLLLLAVFTSAICHLTPSLFAQGGGWTKKANFGGTARFAASGFSIGSKGYIGIGADQSFSNFFSDLWEWDPSTNAWTQKAAYPGNSGATAVSFSIGTKGYIGSGQDKSGSGWTNDFWEYNSITNNWIQRASVPGNPARAWAVGFSIGTKGYIGTGAKDAGSPIVAYDDFWEWDQSSDAWTQKANFVGGPRKYAVGFSIGLKGYIGTGMDNSTNPAIDIVTKDFWEWDQSADSWTQKADFPGTPRGYAKGFSIAGKGYVGMGMDTAYNGYNDFWEYNPSGNSWTQKANGHLGLAVAFATTTKGYLGTGYNSAGISTDFWEFTPFCNLSLSITTTNSSCGQPTGTASVVATGGLAPYTYQWTNGDKTALADSLSAGLYMVLVTDASGCTDTKPTMINDAGAPVITVTSTTNISCNGGNNGAINISVSGGATPYTFLWANGSTNQNMSNLQGGPHQVQVTDASGCMANKIILLNEPAKLALNDSIKNASCGNADGAAYVFVSGGTPPYSYAWSTGATTAVVSNLTAGSYSVMVTDNNGCKKYGMGTIVNLGAASAVVDSLHPVDCASGVGSIYITVAGGAPPYTYLWTNGATTQDLVGVPSGNYGVTIYGSNTCTGAFSGVLPSKAPYTPVICIVTVDTATGKNQCAFVKDSIANLGLKQYNFYRETTTAGVYQKLGSKPANQLSLWTDQSANPLQHAWRYKITAEDSCGNEAPISGMHKTIHLAANVSISNTVNLMWDDYEGFAYGTFIIYRYSPATGWDSLDAVPSGIHSYTDLTPPVPLINVFYFIAVENPSGCVASGKNPQLMASNLNLSKSNVNRIGFTPTGVPLTYDLTQSVIVYPNPTTGKINVQCLLAGQPASKVHVGNVEVLDIVGKKILYKNLEHGTLTLDLTNEPNGVYFLKIYTEAGFFTKKLIIQK